MLPTEPEPSVDKLHASKELESLLANMRDDLKRLIQARLDRRLHGRVDASDIIQETFITAYKRYDDYILNPEVPLLDWIRFLTVQSVQATHRKHLGTQKRSVGREFDRQGLDSLHEVIQLIPANQTGPQTAVLRAELQVAVRGLIESMSDIDREILRLRHEEQMSNQECANRIGISDRAASKRYIRALKRLRSVADTYI